MFSEIFKQSYTAGDPKEFSEYVFDVFDEDKNGTIDFKEFVCAASVFRKGRLDEKMKCNKLARVVFVTNSSAVIDRGVSGL